MTVYQNYLSAIVYVPYDSQMIKKRIEYVLFRINLFLQFLDEKEATRNRVSIAKSVTFPFNARNLGNKHQH